MVSIIIPTYNNEKLVEETLNSVLQQTSKAWECIIVDDGSDDETINICKAYEAKDERFSVHFRPEKTPKGANACRNYGIKISKGDYVVFLDADDVLVSSCIANRITDMNQYPTYDGIVSSLKVMSYTGEKKNMLNKDPEDLSSMSSYASMFLSYQIPWQTTAPTWRKEVFARFGVLDESFQRFQDVELHTRFLLLGCQIKRILRVDGFYRQPKQSDPKYQNPAFVSKALASMYRYIQIFSNFPETSVINVATRKPLLKKMLLRMYSKFILKKADQASFERLLSVGKETEILSIKDRMFLVAYHKIVANNLEHKKGLGGYRLKKYLQKQLGL